MDFAVPADHSVKLLESEKRYKYLDLASEQDKLWNIKVTVIPLIVGVLCTIHQRIGTRDWSTWK